MQVTTLGMLSKGDIKRAPLYKESEYKFVSFSSFHGSFFYDNEMPQAACALLYSESQVLQVPTMLSSSSPPLWKHYTSKCTHRYPFLSSQIMAPCVMAGPAQGKALLLLGCPCGRGETRQINILGEDTWADLESSKIQAQETHFSQKGFQIRKKTEHTHTTSVPSTGFLYTLYVLVCANCTAHDSDGIKNRKALKRAGNRAAT